jgi:sugar/nucleoside kinase (ribokinase family)
MALWDRGNLVTSSAPKIVVKDTVGAGDAFMAGLMVWLTRGAGAQTVVETASRLGAIVASHDEARRCCRWISFRNSILATAMAIGAMYPGVAHGAALRALAASVSVHLV